MAHTFDEKMRTKCLRIFSSKDGQDVLQFIMAGHSLFTEVENEEQRILGNWAKRFMVWLTNYDATFITDVINTQIKKQAMEDVNKSKQTSAFADYDPIAQEDKDNAEKDFLSF